MTVTSKKRAPKKVAADAAEIAAEIAAETNISRPLDGSGNNKANPHWGAAGEQLLRLTPPALEGTHASAPHNRQVIPYWETLNPRNISNLVCREDKVETDPCGRTHWMWAWGQFLDHQLDLTLEGREEIKVEIDPSDPFVAGGSTTITFHRSAVAPGTGVRYDAPREHQSELSAYIDGSSVYGNTTERLTALIGNSGPCLETSEGGLLPLNIGQLDNADLPEFGERRDFFLAGDIRANEHVVLTSLHTTFVRLHNLKVQELMKGAKHVDPVKIFHHARAWVAAVMQVITYHEFLPELLGATALTGTHRYTGYQSGVETTVSSEFSTAAYRLGHSMLPAAIPISGKVANSVEDGDVRRLALEHAFFTPQLLQDHGLSTFLDQLHTEPMRKVDCRISDGVRNFLFRFPTGPNSTDLGLLDLATLNIMRGRDHRLGTYNEVREGLGLPRVTSFNQIGNDPLISSRLQQAYEDVEAIDLWVGGLAEAPVGDAVVGETFSTILLDQFTRLRDGDRYYWASGAHPVLTAEEQAELPHWTLARVLTEVDVLPKGFDVKQNVFNTCGEHKAPAEAPKHAITGQAPHAPGYHCRNGS